MGYSPWGHKESDATEVTELAVVKLYTTLCKPTGCSAPGSSVHRILQARILEQVAISFSRGSSWPRNRTQVSCITGSYKGSPLLEWAVVPLPRGLPNPGIEPRSPTLQADSLLSEPPGKPKNTGVGSLSFLQAIFPA